MKRALNNQLFFGQDFSRARRKRPFAVFACVLLLFSMSRAISLAASPSDVDLSFGSKIVDGDIKKSVVQPDGKLLLVGSFETFTDQPTVGIIRLNADGTRDASFDLTYQKTLFEGRPSDIILQPDGKILAFGAFYYGGDRFNYRSIVRLNSNGTRDTTFTSRLDNQNISSAVLLPDGKIIIGGNFQSYDGQVRSGVARINFDGTLDPTFVNPVIDNNNFGYGISQILLQPDGKLIIAGRFDTVGGQPRKNAARLNADGTLDASFQNPLIQEDGLFAVRAAVLQPDGKIIVGGSITSVGGQARRIARLNADGSLDTRTFLNPDFTGLSSQAPNITRILLQADGKIYIEGEFGSIDGAPRNRRARLNTNGTLDTTFNLDAVRGIQNITLQANGRLLAVGNLIAPPIKGDTVDFFYVREIALDGLVNSIVIQPDNKILIGGEFTSVGGYNTTNGFNRNYIARLNADGTTDLTFNPQITSTLTQAGNPFGSVTKIALQTDGKIIITGSFTSIGGQARSKLARLNTDGSLDTTFQQINIGSNAISAIAAQADGKVLISGSFSAVNGSPAVTLARLNADGTFDSTFQSPIYSSTNGLVSILPLSNGKILIGGLFSFVNGQFTSIARLNSSGAIDATFQIPTVKNGANAGTVSDIITQPDDKIVFAGTFDTVAGQTRKRMARLNTDGTLDASFQDPNIVGNSGALNLAIQKDGKFVVVGSINSVAGQPRNGVARINTDGTLDTTFGDVNAFPNAVAIQQDGKIVIGGNFAFVAGRKQLYISRLLGTPAAVVVLQRAQFDFDGDGKSDASVFRGGTWFINNVLQGFYSVPFGLSTDKLAPADYDGDGKTDIAVWRENSGGGNSANFYILQSTNGAVRIEQFGLTGDRLTVGDWDGDGKADLSVYREGANGAQSYFFYRGSLNNPTNGTTYVPFGTTGDRPSRGDFDGDGKFDAAVFRPSNGVWYILNSGSGTVQFVQFGLANDRLVAADYDGDGKSDVAVFRDGVWYILQSSNNQVRYVNFGLNSDALVPADYDGDGKTDVAVWRNGVYYILQSTNGQTNYIYFGTSGDIPVASAYFQ